VTSAGDFSLAGANIATERAPHTLDGDTTAVSQVVE